MEIEIERKTLVTILIALGLFSLLLVGMLGHAVTPDGGKVLSWGEWQILKAQKAYIEELQQLRQASDEMAGMLNNRPDPVRVQMQADRLQKNLAEGQSSLSEQRSKLYTAAEAIRAWSLGQITREQTVDAHNQAAASLQPTEN